MQEDSLIEALVFQGGTALSQEVEKKKYHSTNLKIGINPIFPYILEFKKTHNILTD